MHVEKTKTSTEMTSVLCGQMALKAAELEHVSPLRARLEGILHDPNATFCGPHHTATFQGQEKVCTVHGEARATPHGPRRL
jgi:hypothetical protein